MFFCLIFSYHNILPYNSSGPGCDKLLQGHAVSQLCKTVEDVTVYGTASAHKHETVKDHVTSVFDRNVDYLQEVRK